MKDGPHTRKISAHGPHATPVSAPAAPPAPSSAAAWDGSAPVVLQQGALLAGVYEPLIELASGGMARVVVGRRVGAAGFQRLVVIKQVHRHLLGRPDFANFFRDEARIASLIHHANVVPVIDVVEAPGELLLVMEYVESVSLSLLRSTATKAGVVVPPPIVFRIFLDMLAGLHAAHDLVDGEGRALDVVHRDVSPQNVIVGVDGVSRLIDFGVAKASHRLTESESGDMKGKYAYMSPEQVAGLPIDRRSDVFAAAVVLFETLSGTRLFRGEHAMETLRRVVDDPLPDMTPFPNIPAALHDVFARALAKDARQRIATAAELAEMIESTVTAASHRRVGEWVTQHCGALLGERRALLEESRKVGLHGSGANRALAAEEIPTMDGPAPLRPSFPQSPFAHPPQAHSSQALLPIVDATEVLPRPKRTGTVVPWVALAATLAVLLFVTVWAMGRARERPAVAAPSGSGMPASAAAGDPASSSAFTPGATSPSGAAGASSSPKPTAAGAATTSTASGASSNGVDGAPHTTPASDSTIKKAGSPRRPPPPPRPDDLQGDPYGSK
jgi:serine/threonine-protein kinase